MVFQFHGKTAMINMCNGNFVTYPQIPPSVNLLSMYPTLNENATKIKVYLWRNVGYIIKSVSNRRRYGEERRKGDKTRCAFWIGKNVRIACTLRVGDGHGRSFRCGSDRKRRRTSTRPWSQRTQRQNLRRDSRPRG